MGDQTDFLDEMVAERVGQNAEFARLLDGAIARRALVRDRPQDCGAEDPSATPSRAD